MGNSGGTRNDIAWETLFEKYQILERVEANGQFTISSAEINEFREARLMTKFDDSEHLPALFRKNGLSILPISRGDYVISAAEAYKRLELNDSTPILYFDFPSHIKSLDYENITSEATAINCAHVSGILGHFLGEADLRLTVSGRMGSGVFHYQIGRNPPKSPPLRVDVRNAQIEIDGGFEGPNSLSLIEAKNSIPYTFLVRQLYYPFRLWRSRVTKPVRSIFLTYANRIFHLHEYRFATLENYSSLSLLRAQRYSLESTDISLDEIAALLAAKQTVEEPDGPFPQADSFERVINLCELLHESEGGILSHDEVTAAYNFVGRQTHYYTAAAMYLGLIDKNRGDTISYTLSRQGRALFQKSYRDRQLGFVEAIIAHAVFAQGFAFYLERLEMPSNAEIVALMKASDLRNINTESTFSRRARTVRGWLGWILGITHV